MQIEDYLAYRQLLFSEYDTHKGTKKGQSLAFQIASISETLAEEYAKLGHVEPAAKAYLTQGEFLFNLSRVNEGISALEKAKATTKSEQIRKWIDGALVTCRNRK